MDPTKLVDALQKHEVPSVSPQMGTFLIEVEQRVLIALREKHDQETKRLLTAYGKALRGVISVAVWQQGGVISQLEQLVLAMARKDG